MRALARALILLCLWPASAHADALSSTLDQPLAEVSHDVTLRIDGEVARYTVRRTFANPGARADEAQLAIDLPHGAAATGLRIRARKRWYSADLLEAGVARQRYEQLTGRGAWAPKDPALLQWVWADQLHLQVFPVLPDAASTVEYTLTAPLEYRDGKYVLSYPISEPGEGRPLAPPVLRVAPRYGDAGTVVRVGSVRVNPGTAVVLHPPKPTPWVGAGAAPEGAGHVASGLPWPDDDAQTKAKVRVDIDHTFAGDLRVQLVTPAGAHLEVTEGAGSDNDIHDTFEIDLPAATKTKGTWHLVVLDEAGRDVGTLDGWSLALGSKGKFTDPRNSTDVPVFIPDAPDGDGDGRFVMIHIEPPKIRDVAARLGRVSAGPGKVFSRLELEAAPMLSQLPRRAQVVFVVDISRSLSDGDVEAQLAVARAYLSHVPDAHVEVVAFGRRAHRLFGALVPAADFDRSLALARAGGLLRRRNGSAIDAGLALAAKIGRGRRGPRRVVALTDALMRTRLSPATVARAHRRSSRGAITHVVTLDDTSDGLVRDDDADLAPIPAAASGVAYTLPGSAAHNPKGLARSVLSLVRPTTIDGFAIAGIDLADADEVPEALREGEGYRAMVLGERGPTTVTVTGKVWARPVRRTVRVSRAFSRATAAFVFSEDEHEDLSPAEMMKVAMFGKAVSPVTSYLAVEPGVRPSTAGIDRDVMGAAFGAGGLGLVGHGAGGGGAGGQRATFEEMLEAAVDACEVTTSPRAGWLVELEVETTFAEVVDVQTVLGASASIARCLEEATWALELGGLYSSPHETHAVSLHG